MQDVKEHTTQDIAVVHQLLISFITFKESNDVWVMLTRPYTAGKMYLQDTTWHQISMKEAPTDL